jgi:hypothetical protein
MLNFNDKTIIDAVYSVLINESLDSVKPEDVTEDQTDKRSKVKTFSFKSYDKQFYVLFKYISNGKWNLERYDSFYLPRATTFWEGVKDFLGKLPIPQKTSALTILSGIHATIQKFLSSVNPPGGLEISIEDIPPNNELRDLYEKILRNKPFVNYDTKIEGNTINILPKTIHNTNVKIES